MARFTEAMRLSLWIAMSVAAVLLTGCAWTKPAKSAKPAAPIVTPDTTLVGKVVSANVNARFVVLNFPLGRLPQVGGVLGVFRNNLKVGEVKVSGPQRDDNIVADVAAGEAQKDDEVRDR